MRKKKKSGRPRTIKLDIKFYRRLFLCSVIVIAILIAGMSILIGELGKTMNDNVVVMNEKHEIDKKCSLLKNELKEKEMYYQLEKYKSFIYNVRYPKFEKIVRAVWEAAQRENISPYLVLNVIRIESNFKPNARSSVAHGLMQINYKVWKEELDIDLARLYEIDYNIRLGIKILKHYYELEKDWGKALFRYNNGYLYKNDKYIKNFVDAFSTS